jgi:hypothetical protein
METQHVVLVAELLRAADRRCYQAQPQRFEEYRAWEEPRLGSNLSGASRGRDHGVRETTSYWSGCAPLRRSYPGYDRSWPYSGKPKRSSSSL